ncbi:Mog1p/PsbP-like protein [Rhizopogon vinicolor AM-OR11-026]|uniref:Mog1p/PsbP-like protein n=1 Tax=Rhizopogon vinicolor AM-OR11-026 TaxID=1314800 RepID=A0A1B7N8Y5_9AGAM|nr:Mog1p/PsbP-like protein [Rhizopogon vinicolor AM-OR11-026]
MQEIPDSQEIFVYRDSGANIIIDILQRVNKEDPEAAAKFHLDAIAEDNDAIEHHSVLVQRPTANELFPTVLDGRQTLKKAGSIHHLRTLFALFRIKEKNHDVVVSFNMPTETGDGPGSNGAITAEQEQAIESDFYRVVDSLRIVDYNLFAV